MKKIYNMRNLLALGLILSPFMALAQGGPPATPIDGGLSVLLVAGGIYGIKKLKDQRKGNRM